MELRPVRPEHRVHLVTFECATVGEPYSLEIEQGIRSDVPHHLDSGFVEALGSWDGDELAALIVFAPKGSIWKVDYLATSVRYRRHKQALRLLAEISRRGGSAQIDAISCWVNIENLPMLNLLQTKFQASIDPPPIDPPHQPFPYQLCTIPASSFK